VLAGGIAAASSYHPGGVNATFVDASARFVADSVDAGRITETPGRPAFEGNWWDYSGPSTYGVWGALGTIAASDIATL